ncbi:MAG: S8 family serine peptidase [Rhodobacteraceae bacterium]|nr:S8 family serine peptidase [Paracoccaceae bacterium]
MTPTDPLFSQQWHLFNSIAGQLDLNVSPVWDDYTGSGVRVAVIDNGFDLNHPDLSGNVNTSIDYDYSGSDFDPSAAFGNNHGTAVMGIIGAQQGNGVGGVGVAWNAELVGFRGFGINSFFGDDVLRDAAGIGNGIGNTNGGTAANGADVINMSGGLGSTVFLNTGNIIDAQTALEDIATNGRGGLGSIFVKSSGNSRAAANSTLREEGTADGYDTVRHSINVAAVDATGSVTNYSTPGANVLVSAFAPSSGQSPGILTTDRVGTNGYNTSASPSGDYTSGFNGTSAAAPQVAGVVALMLEANDQLGWRDIQQILAYSARHSGSDVGTAAAGFEQATQIGGESWFWNGGSNWNGGGMHFSNDYGFGIVDALAAVRLAESWSLQQTSGNEVSVTQDMDGSSGPTALDNSFADFTQNIATDIHVQHIEVVVDFATTYLSDLEVFLTSPDGTRVQLIADTGDSANYDGSWIFGSTAFLGESSQGNWTVRIVDDASLDLTTIRDVDLQIFGSATNADDLFIFTNEFSDHVGGSGGHGTAFNGGSGTNTVNASAVS